MGSRITCRNLIKKLWVLIRVPYMNPNILGVVIGPGFLNQVPTLHVTHELYAGMYIIFSGTNEA